jgi:hypothetical protein
MAEPSGGYLRELLTLLGFDLNETGFKQADGKFRSLIALSAELVSRVVNIGVRLGSMGFEAARAGTDLDIMAKSLGVSVERLQTLGFAASKSGVDLDRLADLMRNLQEKSAEARVSSKELASAFAAIGISQTELREFANDGPGLLLRVGDALSKMTDQSRKAQIAIKLFSEEGVAKGLPFLEMGSAAILAYEEQARELGLVTTAQVAEMRKLTNAQGAINYAFEILRLKLGSAVIPATLRVTEAFMKFYQRHAPLVDKALDKVAGAAEVAGNGVLALFRIVSAIVEAPVLGTLIGILGDVVSGVTELFDWFSRHERFIKTVLLVTLGRYAIAILAAGKAGVAAAVKVAAAWVVANAAALAIPAAILLIALLIEDLFGFMTGKKSLIGEFFRVFLDEPPGKDEHWIIKTIRSVLLFLRNALRGADMIFADFFQLATDEGGILPAIGKLFEMIVALGKEKLAELFTWLSEQWSNSKIAKSIDFWGGGLGEKIADWVHGPTATQIGKHRDAWQRAPALPGPFAPPTRRPWESDPRLMGPVFSGDRKVSVKVEAKTGASPSEIAEKTAQAVDEVLERDRRQTSAAFGPRRVR